MDEQNKDEDKPKAKQTPVAKAKPVEAPVEQENTEENNFSTTDTKNTPEEVMFIPHKNTWQDYSIWRVSTFRSSLYVSYSGKEDGQIVVRGNTLRNVLTSLEQDNDTNQQKLTYQFQVFDNSYISKALMNRKGTQNEGVVPFRFIRANLQSKNVVLFQNSFTIKPNTLQIDKLAQSVVIKFKYNEIMSPLVHISIPTINTKFKQDMTFENDVD